MSQILICFAATFNILVHRTFGLMILRHGNVRNSWICLGPVSVDELPILFCFLSLELSGIEGLECHECGCFLAIEIPFLFHGYSNFSHFYWICFGTVLTFEQSNGFRDFGAEKQCCLEMAAGGPGVALPHFSVEQGWIPLGSTPLRGSTLYRKPWQGRFDGRADNWWTLVFCSGPKNRPIQNNILLLVPCWTLMVEFWKQCCFFWGVVTNLFCHQHATAMIWAIRGSNLGQTVVNRHECFVNGFMFGIPV